MNILIYGYGKTLGSILTFGYGYGFLLDQIDFWVGEIAIFSGYNIDITLCLILIYIIMQCQADGSLLVDSEIALDVVV